MTKTHHTLNDGTTLPLTLGGAGSAPPEEHAAIASEAAPRRAAAVISFEEFQTIGACFRSSQNSRESRGSID